MKKVNYSETIAACDLKLIDLMKICELKVKVIPWPNVIYRQSFNFLFSETTGPFSTKY